MAIANADGSIVLTTKVDQSGLKNGMSTMRSGASSLTKAFGKLGLAVSAAFGVGAIINFGKEASNLATKSEASVQRLIDIYGRASKAVGDFIDANAQALGMSRTAGASIAETYGNLLSVWADQATNAELTNYLLNQTAVVASRTGRTTTDVAERIRSGLLGNTEAIEDLGINVNIKTIEITDAFKRIADGRSWEQLNAYEQAQVRTLSILEQSTTKYGTTVANTTATVRNQYQAAWQDFQATWGEVINRVLVPALQVLTKILITSTAVMRSLFGISSQTITQSDAISQAVDNQNQLTGAVEETAQATKKAVAGFDDLQILSDSAAESATATGGVSNLPVISASGATSAENEEIPSIFSQIQKNIQDISNLFAQGFWRAFGKEDFAKPLNSIKSIRDALSDIFKKIMPNMQNFTAGYVKGFSQMVGSLGSIGKAIFSVLFGGFEKYITENQPFIQEKIASIFDASGRLYEAVGKLWNSFAEIFTDFADEDGVNLTDKIIEIFSNVGLELYDLAFNWGTDIITALSDAVEEHYAPYIKSLVETLSEWIGTFTKAWEEEVSPTINEIADELDGVINEHVKPALDSVVTVLEKWIDSATWLWEHVLKPFGSWLIEYLAPNIASIFTWIGDYLSSAIQGISDFVGGLFDAFNSLTVFFEGVFTRDWEKAWSGIEGYYQGVWESMKGVAVGAINFVISKINCLIRGFNNVASTLGEFFGRDWGNISEIPLMGISQGTVVPTNAASTYARQVANGSVNSWQNIASGGGGSTSQIVLELDGRELGRAIVEQGNAENRRIGTRLVIA